MLDTVLKIDLTSAGSNRGIKFIRECKPELVERSMKLDHGLNTARTQRDYASENRPASQEH